MKKKLLAALLALCMLVSLAACGNKQSNDGGLDESGRYTKAVAAVSRQRL